MHGTHERQNTAVVLTLASLITAGPHSPYWCLECQPCLSRSFQGAECSIQVWELGMRCRNVWHASQLLFHV